MQSVSTSDPKVEKFSTYSVIHFEIIRITPDRYFGADDPHFAVSESAQALYKRLRVRRWKDSVLELGGLDGFSKKASKSLRTPNISRNSLSNATRA